MTRLCAFTIALALLLPGAALADEPWRAINDALFTTLVSPLGSGVDFLAPSADLWASMDAAGSVTQGVVDLPLGGDAQGPSLSFDTHSVSIDGAQLTILSGGIDDLPHGLFLRFAGNDHQIPGLRGSISDCSEVSEPDCTRFDYSRSSTLTLGTASCLCQGQPVDLGQGMVGLSCYFGRGGSYMDYTVGYGPIANDLLSRLVADADGAWLRDLCRGTALARHFPNIIYGYEDEVPGTVDTRLNPDLMPVALAAQGGEDWAVDLEPATIMKQFLAFGG